MELEYAKGWKPDEGAVLVGTVTAVDSGYSEYRGNYPIVTIRPEDGGDEVAVHCFHDGLFNRMMSLRPNVGERVGIQYKGKRASKQNPRNTVAVYVVRMDRRDDDPWSRIAPPQGRPQAPQTAPASDVPADTSDFAPPSVHDDDDIPF
jgi:hypothetical protein